MSAPCSVSQKLTNAASTICGTIYAISYIGVPTSGITLIALGILKGCCFQTVAGISIAFLMQKTLIIGVTCGAIAILGLPFAFLASAGCHC